MGKKILITGSSRGIGLEIAKHFSEDFDVYISGRYADKLEKLCSEYNFKGFAAADLKEEGAAEKIIDAIGSDIDILINNAGVYFYNPIEKMRREDIFNKNKYFSSV